MITIKKIETGCEYVKHWLIKVDTIVDSRGVWDWAKENDCLIKLNILDKDIATTTIAFKGTLRNEGLNFIYCTKTKKYLIKD